MGRNTALSVLFLIVMGGTGFALPDWVDAYDFYGAPNSGSLGATADAAIHNVSGRFSTMPKGGFGPPAAAFKIQNGVFFSRPAASRLAVQRSLVVRLRVRFAPSTPSSQTPIGAQPRALVVYGGARLSSVSSECSATSVKTPSGNAPS